MTRTPKVPHRPADPQDIADNRDRATRHLELLARVQAASLAWHSGSYILDGWSNDRLVLRWLEPATGEEESIAYVYLDTDDVVVTEELARVHADVLDELGRVGLEVQLVEALLSPQRHEEPGR